MKLQRNTKIIIYALAAIIYVAMFVVAVLCSCQKEPVKKCKCSENCTCVCNNQTHNKHIRKMKNIDNCLEILAPEKEAKGLCEWLALKDSTQAGVMENYYVQETKEIPAEKLQKILDKQYYIESTNIVNSSIFMPIVRVSYTSASGKRITLVYSFASARVDLYRNNEMVKKAMLYNPSELSDLLESL